VRQPGQFSENQGLRQLEQSSVWLWALAALLMLSLGVAVATVYLSQVADDEVAAFGPQARGLLAGGLCGTLVLFCLYLFLKQRETRRLRAQLFAVQLSEESVRSRLFGLSSLLEGIVEVGARLDLDVVLPTLVEHVRSALRADQASLMLINDETQELCCRAVAGLDRDFVRGARVKVGEGIAGWVAEHNEPRILNEDQVPADFGARVKRGRNIVTALCVPLALRDRVIGVLNINRLESGPSFTEDDARLVTVFAAHVAIAIERIVEKQHDELTRQAQKLEALGRLAGGVAHDFNNLLTVILGYMGGVVEGIEPGSALHRNAEKVREAAERCAALTRQLLAFGRKQVVRPEVLDLNATVSGMVDLIRHVVPEDISLVTAFGVGLGYVKADPGQIEQVVLNLVLNARDAMPAGGQLTLATRDVHVEEGTENGHLPVGAGDFVVLRVTDTGTGMDRATREHLFEPFFTTKEFGKGTGLGLATVYAIVKESGGEIVAVSELGEGSTFEIYLPRVAGVLPRAGSQTAGLAENAASARVLVVEDEEIVRELAREILEMGGYTVLEARHGVDALRVAENCPGKIDLLLTDVVMPQMNGRELVEKLCPLRPGMRVMYMSGYTGDVLDRLSLSAPGALFVQKPFTPQGLLMRAKEALAGPPPALAPRGPGESPDEVRAAA
jgi:signal transduction histidine kinase